MHSCIFPTKDTFITNQSALLLKSFGLTEILKLQCNSETLSYPIKNATYSVTDYTGSLNVLSFFGTINGSITGSATYISGAISSNC